MSDGLCRNVVEVDDMTNAVDQGKEGARHGHYLVQGQGRIKGDVMVQKGLA